MKKIVEDELEELNFSSEEAAVDTEHTKWEKIILCAVISFLFSQCDIFFSPFTVSFVAAVPFELCFSGFIGGALGYFCKKSAGEALRYTAAVFFTSVFRLVKGKYFTFSEDGYINGIFAFTANFASGIIYYLFSEGEPTLLITLVAESIASFIFSFIFIKLRKIPIFSISLKELSVKDSLFLGLSFCSFIMCGSAFSIEGMSPIRIVCILLILFVSVYKGVAYTVPLAVCIGFAVFIAEEQYFLFPAYILGALLSGLFAPYGQAASALMFALTSGGICIFNIEKGIESVIEIIIASAVFIIIPQKYIASLEELFQKRVFANENGVSGEIAKSLCAASQNIREVSGIVSKVSDKLDSVINPEVNRLFSFLQQRVCDGCEKKSYCWNKNFDSTASDVLTIAGIEKDRKIRLRKYCPRFQSLYSYISDCYDDYAESLSMKMKLREMRKVLTDQFVGMGDFLEATATAVNESAICDKGKAAKIKIALQDSGIYVDAVDYFSDKSAGVTVEITVFDTETHEKHKKIKTLLEFVSGQKFKKAQIVNSEFKTTMIFVQKTAFKIQVGVAQKPFKEGSVCGDSVTVAEYFGEKTVILSDGMGTGSRAKIDSAMTCSILDKLLSSGFHFDSALKILNSSLIMKSTDESIATIDSVKVNLFSGETEFYKAGAALTFIRSNNEITIIEGISLPVGIIRNVELFKSKKELLQGDIVLLLSDGALGEDCGWIHDELLSWSTNNMEDLANHIVKLSYLRSTERTRDDITVVAVKITKNLD